MQKLIILRGYPGSGKTTLGKKLEKDNVGKFIDHNQILGFLSDICGNDYGIYQEIHDLELAMTNKLLKEGDTVIVARGFNKATQIDRYVDVARLNNVNYHLITLTTSVNTLSERIMAPERKMSFNAMTSKEILEEYIGANKQEPYDSEIIINSTKPADEVATEAKSYLYS